jgi:dTMP kinase
LTGRFVTFEGIDGSGKSTQLRMLTDELRLRGVPFVATCEPGGTELGKRLRAAFLETSDSVAPMAELLAFAADRAQHVETLIKPALARGELVISDRYADATAAYQGAGRGFGDEIVNTVIELATGGLKPDLTLFFDVPVMRAAERTGQRGASEAVRNRMDEETADFYDRVRAAYHRIGQRENARFRIVDADAPVEDIHRRVLSLVEPLLRDLG